MTTPEIVYHYTNASGLYGILKNKKLWASSYRYLNDSLEFEYGFNLLSEIYPESTYSGISSLNDSSYTEQLRRMKWEFDSDCLFVCSFSENGNILSQWRAYAGPHSGYAIGFTRKKLQQNEDRLVCCEYNKQKQKSDLQIIVDKNLPLLKAILKDDDILKQDKLGRFLVEAKQIATDIAQKTITFKHESFQEEKEWRLVVGPLSLDSDRILYRVTDTTLTPYVEIDFKDNILPIECIYVGPGPHQKRNIKSLSQMLWKFGLENVKLFLSNIPYRNW